MSKPQVVVIGSGPGGSAFAWSLANAGVKVRILEAGPSYDPASDYRIDREDWERTRFPEKIRSWGRQSVAPLQELNDGRDDLRSWNHLDPDATRNRERRIFAGYQHAIAVGGTSIRYSGETHRMHPAAMQMRSRFGVAADWPVSYDEMEPFYCLAERLIGVAGPPDQGARYRSEPFPLPQHELSYASQVLGRGFEKLGLGWQANSVSILSRIYDHRPPCNYCGQCNRGCPRFDKGTADITLIAKALATGNCELTTHAEVIRLERGKDDRVKSAIYADEGGQQHEVEADLFAVACGAIETPRLLLNSAGPRAPDGLANESGLVGKNLMELLFFHALALHPEAVGAHRGIAADAICWNFNEPDAIEGVAGGFRISPSPLESDVAGPISYARQVVGGWGHAHKQAMRDQFGHVVGLGSFGESLPGPGSFVDLAPGAKDAHGMPKARIHSYLEPMELDRLAFMAAKTREILMACGAEKIFDESSAYDTFKSSHVFGTCRMGTDPAESVVDKDCRSHRWKNLMVVDASVFPSTGGGESPSLTIYANALRAADAVIRS